MDLLKNKGDKKAAGILVKLYYKEIFSYVFKQTRNEELSKDLTQEIFISMLKSIGGFNEERASFRTWIYKIASNKIIDNYRSTYYKYSTIVDELDEGLIGEDNGIEEGFELKERVNEVMDIVNTLNANLQQIFRLKIFGDMTFSEIGVLLELSESTVKTRYYATVRKIKALLEVETYV
ncbi:RNA polymerase sigma factor [Clostridium sp. B9]|uniref:RNA polymerase sigma factor n=1 Tax=Clostridium sp. B9 TaxID=3423224 RepID=UPI003D2ED8B9